MKNATSPPVCWAKLPRAGLGNKLLVWARAFTFANINSLPLYISGWNYLSIGPILRRELSSRQYQKFFKQTNSIHLIDRLHLLFSNAIHEPDIKRIAKLTQQDTSFIFSSVPHWDNFFGSFRYYRDEIREGFYELLSDEVVQQFTILEKPSIAVHIRLGDFRELKPGEDFSRVGLVRTPLSYFVDLIAGIRKVRGEVLPVTIFSDGNSHELATLLSLPNVRFATGHSDIMDLLLISSSKIIVCSAGSTFSYWAAFLADAPVLLHPDHIHAPIRPDDVNTHLFEGGVDPQVSSREWPELLVDNIRSIGLS